MSISLTEAVVLMRVMGLSGFTAPTKASLESTLTTWVCSIPLLMLSPHGYALHHSLCSHHMGMLYTTHYALTTWVCSTPLIMLSPHGYALHHSLCSHHMGMLYMTHYALTTPSMRQNLVLQN